MNVLTAIQLLTQLLTQAQGIGALITKAQSEGRDLTESELDGLLAADTVARDALASAIAAAKGP